MVKLRVYTSCAERGRIYVLSVLGTVTLEAFLDPQRLFFTRANKQKIPYKFDPHFFKAWCANNVYSHKNRSSLLLSFSHNFLALS